MEYSKHFLQSYVLFCIIFTCGCFDISKVTIVKIKRAIKLFEESDCGNPSGSLLVREWPGSRSGLSDSTYFEWYTSPPVLLWDVLYSHPELIPRFSCPFCLANGIVATLRRSGKWADKTWSGSAYEPRVVYDTSFALLLVSHLYICPSNHQVPSHHSSILSSLPSLIYVPFFLTNRAGFTVDMLTQLSSMVDNGLSFHSIANIVHEQYELSYWRLRLRYEQDSSIAGGTTNSGQWFPPFDQKCFPLPHEKIIRSVFISYSLLFDQIFYDDMAVRTSRWVACDHTFKSAANIGFTRQTDGRWIKAMKCIFIVLDNNGKIIHWRFTKGESFGEVSGIFKELKTRFEKLNNDLEGIVIDNCCKWRGQFFQIFPNVLVKLDLFHAVQRFVTSLPMEVRLNTDICRAYGLVFRQPNDLGSKRLRPTPDSKTLLINLESFERKWRSKMWRGTCIFNPAAIKAIANIKLHIMKGCLSDIPINVSTSGNERLHRHMNNVLKTNKIGLETAYVRCSRLFFKINNQLEDNSIRRLLACSISSIDFSKRTDHFGFENFKQTDQELEVVVPEKEIVVYKSLGELTEEIIYNLRKTISVSLKIDDDTSESENEHTYAKNIKHKNNIPLAIADSALVFYEMYKGLSDKGATRLLLKSNIPYSIGLQPKNTFSTLKNLHDSCDQQITDDTRAVLLGHLENFGLEGIEVQGDGNCFFTAVAFHLSNLLHSGDNAIIEHLGQMGVLPSMTVPDLSIKLRNLIVQEWRGDFASDYASFLPDETNYLAEVQQYERPGFFGGNLGDLMPMAMANLLGIPLAIITSEPSTPLISVCPRGFVATPIPIFLAYISSGPGHYNAVSSIPLHIAGKLTFPYIQPYTHLVDQYLIKYITLG
jgi:hypothetical protein